MKKTIVILLLFVFLFQCGIKTSILIAFYIQRDYISKALCENRNKPDMHCAGKCQLKKNLDKEEKREMPLSLLKDKAELLLFIQLVDWKIIKRNFNRYVYADYRPSSYSVFLSSAFHPPPLCFFQKDS